MRDADHMTVGANPIMPVRVEKATVSGSAKSDNAADILARLARVRDEKHYSAFAQADSTQTINANSGEASESISFADFVDIINPLQHIPGVSSLYREITGDEISPVAKVAGNALFLGPIGAVAAIADVVVDTLTGNDIGEHVLSLFGDEEQSEMVADASTATPPEFGSANGQILSAAEPFFFSGEPTEPGSGAIPATPVIGFAGTPQPVALESLPADILAALYSGETGQNPVAQSQTGSAPASDHQLSEQERAPRWNLFTGTENNAGTQVAAQAYGADPLGQMNEMMNEPGTIGYQGGWFSTVMPDIVSRYEHSATLQRQDQRPIVDIEQ